MKISIIGGGFVGATAAFIAAQKGLGEIVLLDIMDNVKGKALDMLEAMPVLNSNTKITGTTDYSDIKDSDIVVVTAGFARKPGMAREDLLLKNCSVITEVSKNIKEHAPNSIVIMVTNPLDVMAYIALKVTGFDKKRVVGMAGILDSARFKAFISLETGDDVSKIDAMVLGAHGDAMVPLLNNCTIDGKPISESLPEEKVTELVERTKNGGAEIVKLLVNGSAYYAPAASIVKMIEAIANDSDKVLPCSAYLEGEYEQDKIFLGVPLKLGKEGIKEIVTIDLTDEEKKLFLKSAKIVSDKINFVIEKGWV